MNATCKNCQGTGHFARVCTKSHKSLQSAAPAALGARVVQLCTCRQTTSPLNWQHKYQDSNNPSWMHYKTHINTSDHVLGTVLFPVADTDTRERDNYRYTPTSPRKPYVCMLFKSSNFCSLLVVNRSHTIPISSFCRQHKRRT